MSLLVPLIVLHQFVESDCCCACPCPLVFLLGRDRDVASLPIFSFFWADVVRHCVLVVSIFVVVDVGCPDL